MEANTGHILDLIRPILALITYSLMYHTPQYNRAHNTLLAPQNMMSSRKFPIFQ